MSKVLLMAGTGSDDDYLRRSFGPPIAAAGGELIALPPTARLIDDYRDRLDAAARSAGTPIIVGGLVVTPTSREVTLDGIPVELSRKEFDLLHLLAQRVGEVITKRDPHRGVAAELRRRRPDRRCPPVVAAAQTRRDRGRAGLSA